MNTQVSVMDVEGIGFTFERDILVNFVDSNGDKSVINSKIYSRELSSTSGHDVKVTGTIKNGENTFNYFSLIVKVKSVKNNEGVETVSVRTSQMNRNAVDFALTSIMLRQIKDIGDLQEFIKHI